MFQFPNTALI